MSVYTCSGFLFACVGLSVYVRVWEENTFSFFWCDVP